MSEHSPLVSVVMATYNRAKLLPRAIVSLGAQSYTNWELIILDDGSTDETADVVAALMAQDPRIRYQWQKNGGLTTARNAGMKLATGAMLTFLDSDDEYAPAHLKLRVDYLAAHPDIELLHGGVAIVGGSDHVPDRHNPEVLIALADCVIGGTFFMRQQVYGKMGGFRKPDYGNDADFMERAGKFCCIAKVDFPTYIYHRETPDSMCNLMEKGSHA